MPGILRFICVATVALGSAMTVLSAAAEPVPLTIVDRVPVFTPPLTRESPTGETIPTLSHDPTKPTSYLITLRNDSEKVITAWAFYCYLVTNDGRSRGAAGRAAESYRAADMIIRQGINLEEYPDLTRSGPIFPGEAIEIEIGANTDEHLISGPFGARICGVTSIVFYDATFAGQADSANTFFEGRAQEAVNALAAIRLISALDQSTSGLPREEALAEIEKVVAAGKSRYSERLKAVTDGAVIPGSAGSASFVELLTFLREEIETSNRHLPRNMRVLETANRPQ